MSGRRPDAHTMRAPVPGWGVGARVAQCLSVTTMAPDIIWRP